MFYRLIHLFFLLSALLWVNTLFARNGDSLLYHNIVNPANKLYQQASKQRNSFIASIEKRLHSFTKVADKVQTKLVYINPEAAQNFKQELTVILAKLNEGVLRLRTVDAQWGNSIQQLNGYRSKADSVKTAFRFLAAQLKDTANGISIKLSKAGNDYAADDLLYLNEQLKESYRVLRSYLIKFGVSIGDKYLSKEFNKINQLGTEIESLTSHPDKAVKRLLQLAYQQPAFASFFAKNSQLASLFGVGATANNAGNIVNTIAGLQERTQLSQALAQNGLSMPSIPQNGSIPDLSESFETFKQKMLQVGASGNEDLFVSADKAKLPRKSLFRQFEFGVNFQTSRSRNGFPARADLGLSIGYKLSKHSIIGIGTAYKLGIGESIQKINFSNEGIELRTFADVKVKKSFWATAGYELHHYKAFQSIADISKYNLWQRSVLVGISKKIQIGNKKSAKMQILWEPISFPANTISSPIKFRIGYQL